ncbi:hypothetical protein [Nocardia sp. NPDC059195]|uniref:hypothetical protein n=1 Tax=Nocardia sp. NPDC059195 TaxID=3346765 RepID=UPI0036CC7CEC
MTSATPPTAHPTPVNRPPTTDDPHTTLEAACPIRVGEEVTGRENRARRGVVRYLHTRDGIAECVVETSDNNELRRYCVPPWTLIPADGDPSPEWRDRMRAFEHAQRDGAVTLMCRRHNQVAEQAEALARRIADIVEALHDGNLPDLDEPLAGDAQDLDSELGYLNEFLDDVLDSGLLTAEEIQHHLATSFE